ncbi:MmcQ/YjbR family DNA-binding protein [Rufibacter tibetensis]|uniref:MmcQ-like protein n=1 Tax=Rufibacter tibetensis TaxID=512763 RepID=A0A0N7HWW7_9BACT|nr:MmcQ/YjbR family DNA-binding protein [Rufibacter tibetensis]ALJ00401.1 hypothetical protein DC20_17255 [Rufibacter tibetensis]
MHYEALRSLCLYFPAVTEDIKWEHDLCFSIAGKMFCVARLEAPFTFSLKVTEEEFEELISSPAIKPAPYLARYKWVLIEDANVLDLTRLTHLVRQSYELIKGKLAKKDLKAAGLL